MKTFSSERYKFVVVVVAIIKGLIGCGIKTNCTHVGLGPAEGIPSVMVLLKDPSPHLSEFRRKTRKTPNG